MNRITASGHLTRDPQVATTNGGTEICALRIAVKRAGRDGQDGYFDVKTFGAQAAACAKYLASGREVAIDGRLLFEEFETRSGEYATRVYIVADSVEFLHSRPRAEAKDDVQPDDADAHRDGAEPAAATSGPDPDQAF